MAIMRATTSVGPPAANGTTKVMDFSGYLLGWACAHPAATAVVNTKI
jgi:hypothetical protein